MSAFEMNTISKQMEQVNFNKDDQEREVSFSQNSATSGHLSFLKDGKPYNYCRVETKTATEIIKNVFKKNVPEGETRTEMMDEAINSVISKALNQYYILKKKIKGDEEKGVGENIIRGHELKSGKLKKDLDTAKYGNKILKEGKGNPAYNKLDKLIKDQAVSSKDKPFLSGTQKLTEGKNSQMSYVSAAIRRNETVAITFHNVFSKDRAPIFNPYNSREGEHLLPVKEKAEEWIAVALIRPESTTAPLDQEETGSSSQLSVPGQLKKQGSSSSLRSVSSTLSTNSVASNISVKSFRSFNSLASVHTNASAVSLTSLVSPTQDSVAENTKKDGRSGIKVKVDFVLRDEDNPENSVFLSGDDAKKAFKEYTKDRHTLNE